MVSICSIIWSHGWISSNIGTQKRNYFCTSDQIQRKSMMNKIPHCHWVERKHFRRQHRKVLPPKMSTTSRLAVGLISHALFGRACLMKRLEAVPRTFFGKPLLFYQATRDREGSCFFFFFPSNLKPSSPSSRRYIFGAIESYIMILKVCYWWGPRCRNHR